MGPYCDFCDFRCFVPRMLPFSTGTLLMATCQRGMAHDRAKTGHDHTTAINPSVVARQPATPARTCEQGERARGTAVALEQENAQLLDRMSRARDLLGEVSRCTCPDDLGTTPDRYCRHCQIWGLLSPRGPAEEDALVEVLSS